MGDRTCANCGAGIDPSAHGRRIHCSEACNRAAQRKRQAASRAEGRRHVRCETCGESLADRRATKFCSKRCTDISRGKTRATPLPEAACALPSCGMSFTPIREGQECCSESHGRSYWRVKAKAAGTYSNGNPETKRRLDRKRTQWRRAKLRDPAAEQIDRDDIGARDGWMCGLCDSPVAQDLAYPHPDSPSLDHILPLSLGGLHIEANVQISHLTCNVRKGARVA